MKEFSGKVAVITGSASGIGRGLADRCAEEGMKVVLADLDEEGLAQAESELQARGATTLTVPTDVSKAEDVETLAQKTLDAFGGVHLLFNNAGVGSGGSVWEIPLAEWQWVMGVNLWGVIHGVRTFVPLMLDQESECHVVNTASLAGLLADKGFGVYSVSKHGVVALSEILHHELAHQEAKVKVSVLCPSYVKTGIFANISRLRPRESQDDSHIEPMSAEEEESRWQEIAESRKVLPVEAIAEAVFDAIRDEQFYVFTHPELKPRIQSRMENVLNARNPTIPEL